MDSHIRSVSEQIIERLKAENFNIQRLCSATTSSIYLKLDYGVCHSIRISDHVGKANLAYRYNVMTQFKDCRVVEGQGGTVRRYYPPTAIDQLMADILTSRNDRISKYGERNYMALMDKNIRDNIQAAGFWSRAELIHVAGKR